MSQHTTVVLAAVTSRGPGLRKPLRRIARFGWPAAVLLLGCGSAAKSDSNDTGDASVPGDGSATGPGDTGVSGDGAVDGGDAGIVGPLAVGRVRTEYRINPIGIDVVQPRLDWQLQSQIRGEKQTAYEVQVASSPALLAARTPDLWDSSKVASDQSTQVVYLGTPLASRETAWWQVKVWDKDGVPSAWSAPAFWEAALAPSDWEASWITTPAPGLIAAGLDWIWYPDPGGSPATSAPAETVYLRRHVTLPAGAAFQEAAISVAADNTFDVYVNGVRAASGTTSIGTAWSNLATVNVGSLLVQGDNVIAVNATNTNVSPAGVLLQLQITSATSSPTVVSTDTSWLSTRATPAAGWQAPGFDDSAWVAAIVAAPYGQGPWATTAPGLSAPGASGGGPARYLRRSFTLAGPVQRARLHATALGVYEASINGKRVGALHFAPGWTDFTKRVQVQTYDVTSSLTAGENVVGLIVGDGWYHGTIGDLGGQGLYQASGPIRALAQLEIELADGTRQVIGTDATWDSTNGPIVASDTMNGEIYEARRDMPGWDAPGFVEKQWTSAAVVYGPAATTPALVAQTDDGVQTDTAITPLSVTPGPPVTPARPGVFVYDLGQNISGWARLSVQGPAGASLTLRFAEVLNPDGSIYTANLGPALATERYTLAGGGVETYEPRFTSHGFRYIELSGDIGLLTAAPTLATVTGIPVHAATPVTGTLVTSDPVINQLQSNVSWSQKDNFTVVPTDCPQRDERLGWMGDAQIFARTATFNMDVAAFYTQWLKDVDEAQSASGAYTNVAPNPHDFILGDGTPAWADAGVIVPWTVYLAYGDTRILATHYPGMVSWVNYVTSLNPGFLWNNVSSRGSDYGDWLSVNSATDKEVLATAFYAHSADILSKVAHILGNTADEAKYTQLFASIVSAFDKAYVTSDGHIQGDTQTTYALALQFGLLPAALRPQVAALLQADIQAHGGYLTTGFIGVGYLLPALTGAGMTPVAYGLLDNEGLPSWRYEIAHGATTTWERWDGIQADGGFYDPGMNSFNHYSFGSVDEWMYETIGGLVLDESSPGWKAFALRPVPGGGLTSAKATLDSPYGLIVSDWSIASGTFTLSVTVPVNTTATVYLPYKSGVTLDGAAAPAPAADGGYAVASGTYVFTALAQ